MENTIYLGLSRQVVLQNNMDIIANNIANVNTPGYRGQNLIFSEFVSRQRGQEPLSFVYDKGQYKNTVAGTLHFTGSPLDIALEGPGFIGVKAPDGTTAYTRAGNFRLSADGTLMTQAGQPVADAGGSPISIPQDSSEIKIDPTGAISNQGGQVGQIMVVEFKNPQALRPVGDNMYVTSETATPSPKTSVRQGQLENSNVQPVIEMTRMIDTLRSFQNVQQILQSEGERLRTAIQRLSRAG